MDGILAGVQSIVIGTLAKVQLQLRDVEDLDEEAREEDILMKPWIHSKALEHDTYKINTY